MASKLGPDFDKLTWASGVSNIGDGLMGAALPLLVASLTRDPVLVAGAAFASRLPWFLFALISGALADRMDRKRLMVVTDGVRALAVGLLALAVWTGDAGLTAVYLVAFGLGIAETFFDTSAEAFTPRLVDKELLPAANGRLQAVEWVGGTFAGHRSGRFSSPWRPRCRSWSMPCRLPSPRSWWRSYRGRIALFAPCKARSGPTSRRDSPGSGGSVSCAAW